MIMVKTPKIERAFLEIREYEIEFRDKTRYGKQPFLKRKLYVFR